jgi:hypothetical protein
MTETTTNGRVLGRGEILEALWAWPKPVRVEVPTLDGAVYVRMLTAAEKDRFEAASVRYVDGKAEACLENVRARLVGLCACNEGGGRLFTDDDVDSLGDLPASLIDPIFEAAQKVNGMGRSREEAAKN